MKRSEMPQRTVGLARGAVRLPRKSPLAGQAVRQPRQRPSGAPKAAGWSQNTRDVVQARSGGRCEARLIDCTGEATDMHHRQPRRTGLHTVENAIHVCRADHQWIHGHPALARLGGYIVPTWEDPAATPVRIRGWLCWLTEAGRYVGEVQS